MKTLLAIISLALSLFPFISCGFEAFFLAAEVASNPLSQIQQQSPLFLQDVVKAISIQQGWNLKDIRVSRAAHAKVGSSQRFEFRFRIGKSVVVIGFSDGVALWKKLKKRSGFGPDLITQFGEKRPVLKGLKLEGPIEVHVDPNHELSLLLPFNTTLRGLKRVLVSEGITVVIKGAQEVTVVHPSNYGLPVNRSLVTHKSGKLFWPIGYSACMPLLPVHILGSASLVAYRSRNPNAHIQAAFMTPNTVELLPEKCYSSYHSKNLVWPFHFLNSRLALVEKLLRSFLGDRIFQNQTGLLKAKIAASTIVRFQLELERDLGNNDSTWDTLAAWRTKLKMERIRFEIVAKVEAEQLKPLLIKKVIPFVALDTTAWSNLMSNVSFTQIPSLVVPPESLTLDVKW